MDALSFFFLLVFLLVLSGFFSGGEIALVTLSKASIRAMQEKKLFNADIIAKIKSKPNRLLITILIGNNLVNISASVVATYWATEAFGSDALGYVTGILTLLVLIFGEIFPKTIAQRYAQRFSQIIARPIYMLEYVFYPVIIALEWLLGFLMKQLNKGSGNHSITPLSELKAMVQIASEDGYIEDNVEDIITNVFSFDKKEVSSIMTSEPNLTMIDKKAGLKELRNLFIESSHSRIPVYHKNRDKVIGIVNMRELLISYEKGKRKVKSIDFETVIEISPSTLIDDLLIIFQEQKQQIAVVKDGNSTVGIVTMENVLEELVGEIFDETEKNRKFIKKYSKDCFLVRHDCPMNEIRKYFDDFELEEQQFISIESVFQKHIGNEYESGRNYKINNYLIKPNSSKKDGAILNFIICRIHNH